MRRGLTAILLWTLAAAVASGFDAERIGNVATLPPIGDHWVWVPDRLLEHSLLYDGDSGKVLGTVDSNASITPKVPLVARTRGEIYSVDIDYARGRRGARTDFVTIYDATTLHVAGEVLLSHPTSESNSSVAHTALLDGDRFLVVFSQFPATLASVVDLEERRVVGEVSIAGCAGLYAAGRLRFATLCGDGSVVMAELDERGALRRTARSERFFDVVEDPVSMAGARHGSKWVFVSFAGFVHGVDFSGTSPRAESPWSLVDDGERGDEWRPGGLQQVTLHQATQQLYVVMHQGGAGTHKDPGPEIWAYDLARRTRVERIQVPNLAADFLGPLLGLESGGLSHRLLSWATPNPGVHAIAVTQDDRPLLFARNADLGVVAVLDPTTGEHLRNLEEAGLAGPTLGVP
jgi:methylamine dehydrogenase heavy chain